jgi:hypothetical protein
MQGRNTSPRTAEEGFCPYVCKGCDGSSTHCDSRRRPVRCKKQTTKWSDVKALPKEIMESCRLVYLRGETVPSLNSLTNGCVMTKQQGYPAVTPRQGLRHEMKIFLPYRRKLPGPPCGQSDLYPGKRTDCTWKGPRSDKAVADAVRQCWTTTSYR